MKKRHLTLKTFGLIVLNDFLDTIAQLLFKQGLLVVGIGTIGVSNILEFSCRSASSLFVWAGIAFYLINFFVWIIILYRIDLSIAIPVGSTAYIFIALFARFFFNEHISFLRWVGIGFIVLGIHFVSRSRPRSAGKAPIP